MKKIPNENSLPIKIIEIHADEIQSGNIYILKIKGEKEISLPLYPYSEHNFNALNKNIIHVVTSAPF